LDSESELSDSDVSLRLRLRGFLSLSRQRFISFLWSSIALFRSSIVCCCFLMVSFCSFCSFTAARAVISLRSLDTSPWWLPPFSFFVRSCSLKMDALCESCGVLWSLPWYSGLCSFSGWLLGYTTQIPVVAVMAGIFGLLQSSIMSHPRHRSSCPRRQAHWVTRYLHHTRVQENPQEEVLAGGLCGGERIGQFDLFVVVPCGKWPPYQSLPSTNQWRHIAFEACHVLQVHPTQDADQDADVSESPALELDQEPWPQKDWFALGNPRDNVVGVYNCTLVSDSSGPAVASLTFLVGARQKKFHLFRGRGPGRRCQ